jgi:hypothetical protein
LSIPPPGRRAVEAKTSTPLTKTRKTKTSPEARAPRPPRQRSMAYVLEESASTPSRKSTRKSQSRLKSGSQLARGAKRRKHSPKARASRAGQQRRRSRGRL